MQDKLWFSYLSVKDRTPLPQLIFQFDRSNRVHYGEFINLQYSDSKVWLPYLKTSILVYIATVVTHALVPQYDMRIYEVTSGC